MRLHAMIGWLAIATGLGGCAVSYVNIPPLPGDTALHSPDLAPAPELMTGALSWVTTRYEFPEQYAVSLPEGTGRGTYKNIVAKGTRDRGVPLMGGTDHLPVCYVASVKIRGGKAEVRVIRPSDTPPGQGVTVRFASTWGGWKMVDSRTWEAGVIDLPQRYYVPGTDPYEELEPEPEPMEEEATETEPPVTDEATTQPEPEPLVIEEDETMDPSIREVPIEEPTTPVEVEEPPAADPEPEMVVVDPEPTEEADDATADAAGVAAVVRYVLRPDGVIVRDGEVVPLGEAFDGIGRSSIVHLWIEQTADGREAGSANAMIASFRIRQVRSLTVERGAVPAGS
jgi:hypothetical protein